MTNLANEFGSVNLGQGFPDEEGPESMKQIVGKAVYDFPNQYPPALGIPELRKAIATHSKRFSGLPVDWQTETVVTVGATEALASAFMGFLNEGDEVIMLEPLYDSYAAMARRAGGKIVPVSLQPPDWNIPRDKLEAAFSPRTKAILVNSPHNPTGTAFSKPDLEAIAALCKQHDVIAICDEVYEHLTYEGTKHISLRTLPGMAERSIRIGSAGKTFSFTAWKVGWATGPAHLIAALAKAHSFLVFTVPSNLQRAVAHGLDHESSFYCGLSTSLQAKRDLLEGHLKTAGFSTLRAHGSYFITADISKLAHQDEKDVEFCYRITKEAGVTALPVSAFYVSDGAPRNLIRFCFCKNDAKLEDAAPAVKQPTDWVTDAQGKEELIQLISSRGFGVFNGDSTLAAQRVEELRCLLPGLSLRAAERSSHPLVKLLADMDQTLERLLSLQQLLPDVDVATLVSKRLDLLLEEPEEVDKAVRRKADAVGFDLADADQWFVNSPDAWHERHWTRRQAARRR
ncbi:hypothetical protein WJX74_003508 [Apatococcus lobatus]|uniref:Aminotransferase class I/classII large domain-containing protein n=1 Tax=Apatococcus lobatus TaxID=904363 RepID=A0AAW1S212_9CHLO